MSTAASGVPGTRAEAASMADAAEGADLAAERAASSDPVDASSAADAAAELARLRAEIERIDRGIVGLIAERVAVARRVGPLKQALGMPILDPPREAVIVRRAGELARDAGLHDEDVRYVFWHLVGLSRRVQLEEG
ncbi:MAG TPA: chorismate mutase [Longimicrobium sp.]